MGHIPLSRASRLRATGHNFAERVYIRILKYVDGHDDLIVPRYDDNSLCGRRETASLQKM